MTPGEARGYLARFLFRGDDVFKEVRSLSGGERSRLELALLGICRSNLLLLDEPTNHLDIPAREALEAFLRETPATLLVVSHDRRLLETTCDRLWVVDEGRVVAVRRAATGRGGRRSPRAGRIGRGVRSRRGALPRPGSARGRPGAVRAVGRRRDGRATQRLRPRHGRRPAPAGASPASAPAAPRQARSSPRTPTGARRPSSTTT